MERLFDVQSMLSFVPGTAVCLSNELHLNGGMVAGCEFIVMKFCLMNKEKALRSVLAITHVYVVKIDIVCFKI